MILKAMSGVAMLFPRIAMLKGAIGVGMTTLGVVCIEMSCARCQFELPWTYKVFCIACMVMVAIAFGMWSMLPRTVAERHPSHRLHPQFNCYATKKDLESVRDEPRPSGSPALFAIGDRVMLRHDPSYQGTVLQITHAVRDNGMGPFVKVTVNWDARYGEPNCWPSSHLIAGAFSFGDRVKLRGHSRLGTVQWHSKSDRPHKVKVEWDNGSGGIHQPATLLAVTAKSQSDVTAWPARREG